MNKLELTMLLLSLSCAGLRAATVVPVPAKPALVKPLPVKPLKAPASAPESAVLSSKAPTSPPVLAQRYLLDPLHSTLQFQFTQAGALSPGDFKKFTATLSCAAAKLLPCAVDLSVSVSSLNTQDRDRDQTLRGADLFDVPHFPEARFHSTRFEAGSDAASVRVIGSLTLRDHTRPLSLRLSWRFATENNVAVAYLGGQAVLNRLDFGVGQGEWASTEWVANAVNVSFQLRFVGLSAQL
jgi:polyisoprenoid-binding protein YceI